MKEQDYVKIDSYIPADNISSVKKGQEVRFKVAKNMTKPLILSGKIINISVAAINSNKGNFYKVTALARIDSSERKQLKYGMDGSVSIITGKTTFFNYYKNKLFGNE